MNHSHNTAALELQSFVLSHVEGLGNKRVFLFLTLPSENLCLKRGNYVDALIVLFGVADVVIALMINGDAEGLEPSGFWIWRLGLRVWGLRGVERSGANRCRAALGL